MNKIFLIVLLLSTLTFSQVSADLTIENQLAIGNDYFFDIYITSTGTNPVYLGNADFVLTFNASDFTSPVITSEGDTPGFCTLVPTIQNATNILFTQDLYFNNTSVEITNGNELLINLNGPTPSTQTNFDTRVARIDNTVLIHRLGRFKVSGIENTSGFMNLQWKMTGAGVTTQVFTLDTVSPWNSTQVTVNAIDPNNTPLPVELTSFTASARQNNVTIKWQTATETNNYGFNIERKVQGSNWDSIAFIKGYGNSNSPKEYSYIDKDLFGGGSQFNYRLKQIDNDGTISYSAEVELTVIPDKFELSQNYPNPFNPSTKISWQSPVGSWQTLKVYDMLGNEVATLVDEHREAGRYEVTFDGSNLASGMYLYRLQAGSFIETRKMILIK